MNMTSFSVKNFKSIGNEGVTINFAPINLLFGLNCSGKSNIIQALQFASKLLENPVLDFLGREIFYRHELDREIIFRFEFQEKEKISSEITIKWDRNIDKPIVSRHIYLNHYLINNLDIWTNVKSCLNHVHYSSDTWNNHYDTWKLLKIVPSFIHNINNDIHKFFGDTFEYRLEQDKDSNQIVFSNKQGVKISPNNIGKGISNIISIISMPYISFKDIGLFILEYPESNIHPEYQLNLADFLLEKTVHYKNSIFLIETNSEHIMLRILRRIREYYNNTNLEKIIPEDIATYYIQKQNIGSKANHLEITPDGDFLQHWPDGFFEERIKEIFKK